MAKNTPEEELYLIVKALLDFGGWYPSAIELHIDETYNAGLGDGQDLKERAKRAVADYEQRRGEKPPDAP